MQNKIIEIESGRLAGKSYKQFLELKAAALGGQRVVLATPKGNIILMRTDVFEQAIQSAKKEAVEKLVNSLEYAKPIDKLDNEEVNLRNENLVYGFNMAISKIKQKAKELLK